MRMKVGNQGRILGGLLILSGIVPIYGKRFKRWRCFESMWNICKSNSNMTIIAVKIWSDFKSTPGETSCLLMRRDMLCSPCYAPCWWRWSGSCGLPLQWRHNERDGVWNITVMAGWAWEMIRYWVGVHGDNFLRHGACLVLWTSIRQSTGVTSDQVFWPELIRPV